MPGPTLDVSDGFDVHEYRHQLKLLREDRETAAFANREGLHCPACGDPFDRLLVSERREHTFGEPGGPICVVRSGEALLVLTH
jgi:hypothetical protein